MKRIAFRADASVEIGTGHLLRCLALAQELQAHGAEIAFLCRELEGNLFSRVQATHGIKLFPLLPPDGAKSPGQPYPHSHWLGTSQEHDAAESLSAMEKNGFAADAVVVDHYALGAPWEARIGAKVDNVLAIDDLADRPHDCHFLLDQNFSSRPEARYEGLIGKNCQPLLGPRYALLRPEFSETRASRCQTESKVARKLLVFFGGTDLSGDTLKSLDAIALFSPGEFETTVVIGKNNFRRTEVERRAKDIPNTHCAFDVPNMAELMQSSDLFLGAGGITSWERCCLGLPSIVIAVANNQIELCEELAKQGYVAFLGESAGVSIESIASSLRFLREQPLLRQSMATKGRALVDGRGAARIAGILTPPKIELRPATAADSENVFRWRNAEETRKYIFDSRLISAEQHRKWFSDVLSSHSRRLLIGFSDGLPLGVLRYDLISKYEAKISVYLVPKNERGPGNGSQLLRAGNAWLKSHLPEITSVIAEVLAGNKASYGAFRKAGYTEQYSTYRYQLDGSGSND